jgi:HEAT repeat protein
MRRLALALVLCAGFDWAGAVAVARRDLASPNPQTRLEAVKRLADFDTADAAPLLLPALKDSDPGVRLEAAHILGRKRVVAAVQPVAEWIASPDKGVRAAAAGVLGDIGAPEAAAPLVRALADIEAEVRRAAVDALGQVGGPEVAAPLIGRLDDDAAQVRREAAERLMDLGDRQAVIPLVERFGDANKDVRIAAIRAVGRLGDARAIPALLRLLRDPLDEVRVVAVEALGNLRAREALPDLVPLLGRGSEELRVKATYALGKIGDAAAVQKLLGALANETLRAPAREALIAVGEPAVAPLVDCLRGRVEGCDAASAVAVLRVIGDARATPALVAELDRGRVRRSAVVQALGALGDRAALVPLLALADDADAEVRRLALEAMRPIVDGRAAEALQRLLADRSPAVRELAAAELGALGVRAAVPALLELATKERAEGVAAAAVRALGALGDPRATGPLLALLASGRPEVAREAADALGRLADRGSRAGLLAVARDPAAPARAGAVWALGCLLRGQRDDEAERLFAGLLGGGDLTVALAALDALAALGDPAALPPVLSVARGSSRELRRAALEALGGLPADAAADALLVATLDVDDDALRGAAAWALAERGASVGQDELLAASTQKGPAGATNAVAALALRAALTGRPALEKLAAAADARVRANALFGLARLPADAALVALVRAAARDPQPLVRAAAARALARLAPGDGALVALAHDPERAVRRAASEPARDAAASDWVHVLVTDDAGEPVRHALYTVARPDGLVKAGYTDLRGELGLLRVPPGTADVDLVSSSEVPERAP